MGVKRWERQIKTDNFLKMWFEIRIIMKDIYSKAERFLIRHNRKFVLKSDESFTDSDA